MQGLTINEKNKLKEAKNKKSEKEYSTIIENDEDLYELPKFLFILEPNTSPEEQLFVICSIPVGTIFVALFLIINGIIFFITSYNTNGFILVLIKIVYFSYFMAGLFCSLGVWCGNYLLTKLSYYVYQIIILAKFLGYIVLIFVYLIKMFFSSYLYYKLFLDRLFGAFFDLLIMSYFLYCIYAYLVRVKGYRAKPLDNDYVEFVEEQIQ